VRKNGAFDSVVIEDKRGQRRLTPDAFLALPLRDRVRMILQNQARFFLGGRPVEARVALRAVGSPTPSGGTEASGDAREPETE
jgi:hypothetical protein